MSIGSVLEFYDGGFRSPEVNKHYYPIFGPYIQLEQIANKLMNGEIGEYGDYFEVEDVTGTILPFTEHDIMDEAGGIKICTVTHKSLMELLGGGQGIGQQDLVTNMRNEDEPSFRLSNQSFKDEVLKYDIETTLVQQ